VFTFRVLTAAGFVGGQRLSRLKSAAYGSFYLTDESGMVVVEGPVIFAMRRDGAWESGDAGEPLM